MKIIYDNEKFQKDKVKAEKTHYRPLRIANVTIGMTLFYVLLLIVYSIYCGLEEMPVQMAKGGYAGICCGIMYSVMITFIIFLVFFKPCSANTEYGFCKEKYEIIQHCIKQTNVGAFYEVFYKNKKGKKESIEIPLVDNGFFAEITDDVIDLTASLEKGEANWYKPLNSQIETLNRTAKYHPLSNEILLKIESAEQL